MQHFYWLGAHGHPTAIFQFRTWMMMPPCSVSWVFWWLKPMHQIKVQTATLSMETNCSDVSKYRSLCSVTLSQITARLPPQSVILGLLGVWVLPQPSAHKPVTCSVGAIISMKYWYGKLSALGISVLHLVKVWGSNTFLLSAYSVVHAVKNSVWT